MTSSQKLKKENNELKKQLRTMILHPGSLEAMIIKAHVKINCIIDNELMKGSPSNGILKGVNIELG